MLSLNKNNNYKYAETHVLKPLKTTARKMFPCWFCVDVNCWRKNNSKRERNINFFTVPTLHDSQNFNNDTTEKCYLRLIQCITKQVY